VLLWFCLHEKTVIFMLLLTRLLLRSHKSHRSRKLANEDVAPQLSLPERD
jgi:hypothetical protein